MNKKAVVSCLLCAALSAGMGSVCYGVEAGTDTAAGESAILDTSVVSSDTATDDTGAANDSGALEGTTDGINPQEALDAEPSVDEAEAQAAVSTDPKTVEDLAALHVSDLPDGTYKITSLVNGGYALAVSGGSSSNGASAVLGTNDDADAQRWIVSHDADGFVTITNVKSGKCLDVPGASSKNGTKLQQYAGNGSRAQKWVAVKLPDGSFKLVSALGLNIVMDLDGGIAKHKANVQLYKSNGSTAQKWGFEAASSERQVMDQLAAANVGTLSDGASIALSPAGNASVCLSGTDRATLKAVTASSANNLTVHVDATDKVNYIYLADKTTGKVLDVSGGSTASGSAVQFYKSNGSYAQRWIAVANADGSIKLVSALKKNLVLDCTGGSTASGTKLQVYTDNGSSAQKWKQVDLDAARAQIDTLAEQNKDVLADGTYAIVSNSVTSRRALDVASGSTDSGANVRIWRSNGTAAQRWKVSHDAQGYVILTNVKSGKALDVSGGSSASGTNVQQYKASSNNYAQRWIAVAQVNGGYRLYSAVAQNLVLDIAGGSTESGANAQVYTNNDSAAQTFYFVNSNPSVDTCEDILPSGWMNVHPCYNMSLSLDVSGGSVANGANVQAYGSNGSLSQLFSFEYKNGYYVIRAANSGKVLDVDSGDVVPGTNVQQWNYIAGDASQLWSATQVSDGAYAFTNKATGLVLSVSANGASGANVQADQVSDLSIKTFSLTPQTDLLQGGLYTISLDSNSSMVLDVASGSADSGANVQLYSSNGSVAQRWLVSKVSGKDNTYTIEAMSAGKLLTVQSNGNVDVRTVNGSTAQQWVPKITGGGIAFRSASNANLYLGATGTGTGSNVIAATRDESSAMRFRLKSTNASIDNGTYFIRLNANPNQVLDVSAGSTSNGANVQLYANNDSGAQKWNISRNSDGSFRIVNAASGKALDVKDANGSVGANVQQWQTSNNAAQRWYIEYAAGGFRLLSAVNRNLVLAVTGAGNSSNAQLAQQGSDTNQGFSFKKTTYTAPKPQLPADQLAMYEKAQGYSSNTQWLILVDTHTCRVGIFNGRYGAWNLKNFWACSPGKDSTPTVIGQYTVNGRGYSFGSGFTCYYWVRFYNDYLFHSIEYYQNTFNVLDGRLGQRISHGCVRMDINNAKWVYDNIPDGTKVVTY